MGTDALLPYHPPLMPSFLSVHPLRHASATLINLQLICKHHHSLHIQSHLREKLLIIPPLRRNLNMADNIYRSACQF